MCDAAHVVFPKGASQLTPDFVAQAETFAFGQASAADAAQTFLDIVARPLG